eukprot:11868-Heterococcus_DN1.PRE.3
MCKHCPHKQQTAAVARYKQQRSELREYTAAVGESLHTWMALVPWSARILWHSSDYLDKMSTDANGLPVLRGHAAAVWQVQKSEDAAVQQGCANKDSSIVKAIAAVAAVAAPDWITAVVQCAGG